MVFVLWIKKIALCLFVPRSLRFKQVKDELIVITGAGSGIGRLLAQLFAEKQATVIIWDVNEEGLLQTAKLVEKSGGRCHAFICDVSDRKSVYTTAEKIRRDIGRVTMLINNAGIVSGGRFLEIPDEKIVRTMEGECILTSPLTYGNSCYVLTVNSLAHFWTLKAFLPDMRLANYGHIVTIASYAGLIGCVSMSDYCASKFAAVGLAESISVELATDGYDGVKSTIVCPFLISTGLFTGATDIVGCATLDPMDTANAIFEAILLDQPLLILPKTLYITNFLKGFIPCESQVRLVFALNAHKCMKDFTGRKSLSETTEDEEVKKTEDQPDSLTNQITSMETATVNNQSL